MEIDKIAAKIHQQTGLSSNELEIYSDCTKLYCSIKKFHIILHEEFQIPQNDTEIQAIVEKILLKNKEQKIAKKINDIYSI